MHGGEGMPIFSGFALEPSTSLEERGQEFSSPRSWNCISVTTWGTVSKQPGLLCLWFIGGGPSLVSSHLLMQGHRLVPSTPTTEPVHRSESSPLATPGASATAVQGSNSSYQKQASWWKGKPRNCLPSIHLQIYKRPIRQKPVSAPVRLWVKHRHKKQKPLIKRWSETNRGQKIKTMNVNWEFT